MLHRSRPTCRSQARLCMGCDADVLQSHISIVFVQEVTLLRTLRHRNVVQSCACLEPDCFFTVTKVMQAALHCSPSLCACAGGDAAAHAAPPQRGAVLRRLPGARLLLHCHRAHARWAPITSQLVALVSCLQHACMCCREAPGVSSTRSALKSFSSVCTGPAGIRAVPQRSMPTASLVLTASLAGRWGCVQHAEALPGASGLG